MSAQQRMFFCCCISHFISFRLTKYNTSAALVNHVDTVCALQLKTSRPRHLANGFIPKKKTYVQPGHHVLTLFSHTALMHNNSIKDKNIHMTGPAA